MASANGCAVLLYDGFVTLGAWRTDAIMVEMRSSSERLVMAVPYRNASDPKGFAVFKPKFVECSDKAANWATLGEAFFRGVDAHEKGSAVWSKSIDQSR